jgi:hypothetical protein
MYVLVTCFERFQSGQKYLSRQEQQKHVSR